MYKSLAIFIFILILFSSTIIYLSTKTINQTLDESSNARVNDTLNSISPMIKTAIDFSLISFLDSNLDEIVRDNNYISRVEVVDDKNQIISASKNHNTYSENFISKSFIIDVNRQGLIKVFPSNFDKNSSMEIYKNHIFNFFISIPFLIIIAIFLYGSIIALHNKEKQKAFDDLKKQMDEEIENHEKKTNIMFHQSRLASMGEMISNIAHQWRQPLNTISLVLNNLKIKYAMNNLDKNDFNSSMEKIDNSLQFMSETITTFRNFYKINSKEEVFYSNDVINESINVIGSSLEDSNIEIILDNEFNEEIKGFKNELTQVLVSILVNSKDIFEKRNIPNPKILIKTFKPNSEKIIISIEDNGGGIEDEIIDLIFDPYFTTKHKTQGTGLGLYTSKIIIKDKFEGNLSAINIKNGARFDCELNIHKKEEN